MGSEMCIRDRRWPSAEPLILYMCRPRRQPAAPPCEGLYSDVATAYHTRELSLAKAMGEAISNVAWAEGRTQSTIPSARAASASARAPTRETALRSAIVVVLRVLGVSWRRLRFRADGRGPGDAVVLSDEWPSARATRCQINTRRPKYRLKTERKRN